jgi:hypothetical protein
MEAFEFLMTGSGKFGLSTAERFCDLGKIKLRLDLAHLDIPMRAANCDIDENESIALPGRDCPAIISYLQNAPLQSLL